MNKNKGNDFAGNVLYAPGEEPDNIKIKLEKLFAKLDEIYPDKIVISLYMNYKELGKEVTNWYRDLGYPDGNAFLEAYGYKVEMAAQGRPAADYSVIIDELKKRYAEGPTCRNIDQLKDENPDLAPKFKSMQNRGNEMFGMSFVKYLREEGILIKRKEKEAAPPRVKTDGREEFEKLKERYTGKPYEGILKDLQSENPDLNWSAIKGYQSKTYMGITFKAFLEEEGIITEKREKKPAAGKPSEEELRERTMRKSTRSQDSHRAMGEGNKGFSYKRENTYLSLKKIKTKSIKSKQVSFVIDGVELEVKVKGVRSVRTPFTYTSVLYDMYVAEDYIISPQDVMARKEEEYGEDYYAGSMYESYEVSGDAPKLTEEEIEQRYDFFTSACTALTTDTLLEKIATTAPKKKNKTFKKRFVTRIASAGMMTGGGGILEMIGKAVSDNVLEISIQVRPYTREEIDIIENDFLTDHFNEVKAEVEKLQK